MVNVCKISDRNKIIRELDDIILEGLIEGFNPSLNEKQDIINYCLKELAIIRKDFENLHKHELSMYNKNVNICSVIVFTIIMAELDSGELSYEEQ